MIEVSKVNSILKDNIYEFDHRKKKLSEKELKKLTYVSGLNFRFGTDSDALEFKSFLKEFLALLLIDYKLYFIYVEKQPKSINKIRSHKKLLYPHKKKLGKSSVFEEEIRIKDEISLLASIVNLETKNLDYIVDNLINSIFTFGYLVKKGKRSFSKNREEFLKKIIKRGVTINKLVDLNILKLTNDFITKNSAIFRIRIDGGDNQFIDLFTPKNKLSIHYNLITGKIQDKLLRN